MGTLFKFIHLSDFHFCLTPNRQNLPALYKRFPRAKIDTLKAGWQRVTNLDFASLIQPNSYAPDVVNGVAQFCYERSRDMDAILISGDLATTGLMSDIVPAYNFISNPSTQGYRAANHLPTLGATKARIMVVAGNHDKFVDEKANPNGKNFELKFTESKDYLSNFKNSVGHLVRKKVSPGGERFIAVVSADFSLIERNDAEDRLVGPFGQGRTYPHILDELKNRSFSLRKEYPGITIIWMVHFAPYDCGYELKFIDFSDIVMAARAIGVAITLCGHTHIAHRISVDRHVVYCSGAAGCIDSIDDSRVHVVRLDVEDRDCHVSRENFVWSKLQHEFVFHSYD